MKNIKKNGKGKNAKEHCDLVILPAVTVLRSAVMFAVMFLPPVSFFILALLHGVYVTYMWVQLYTSLVHPSRHELHVQLKRPARSSRREVVQITGSGEKSAARVLMAGST